MHTRFDRLGSQVSGAALSVLLVGLVTGSAGCDFGEGDAKVPGENLGTFHIVARMQSSTCGPGALGSQDVWEFDVQMSRDAGQVFWLNGEEPVSGSLAADGVSFAFDTSAQIQLIEPGPGVPGCAVVRTDRASGQLDSSEEVLGFSGRLGYGFVPAAGSDCTQALGVEGGFYALPCEIQYEMSATRTEAPPED
ncbi:MAG: hypothetical protein R3B89_23190 [Polyangiaceae bacterium]